MGNKAEQEGINQRIRDIGRKIMLQFLMSFGVLLYVVIDSYIHKTITTPSLVVVGLTLLYLGNCCRLLIKYLRLKRDINSI